MHPAPGGARRILNDIGRHVRCFDADALREARRAAGLTQQQIADRVGMQRTNYVAYESGRRAPGPTVLAKLAEAAGVATRQLTSVDVDDATLRDLRESAGLTTVDVARAVPGWSYPSSYQAVEDGRVALLSEHVGVLAGLFGVSEASVQAAYDRASR